MTIESLRPDEIRVTIQKSVPDLTICGVNAEIDKENRRIVLSFEETSFNQLVLRSGKDLERVDDITINLKDSDFVPQI